jgi:hypothetical protein
MTEVGFSLPLLQLLMLPCCGCGSVVGFVGAPHWATAANARTGTRMRVCTDAQRTTERYWSTHHSPSSVAIRVSRLCFCCRRWRVAVTHAAASVCCGGYSVNQKDEQGPRWPTNSDMVHWTV